MMCTFINEECDKVNLFESAILGISFCNHASKIEFIISWLEGYENEKMTVICDNCSNIDFNFKHIDEQIGELVITGFSYLKKSEMSYWIQFDFDFTPKGYIRLLCSEFSFNISSPPIQIGGNDHRIPWDLEKKVDNLDCY